MRVLILGAGTVGTSIADLLCHHGHSVSLVDQSALRVREVSSDLDVRGITGSASQSSVLFQAGVSSTDVCLAVTGSDEVNIMAASMAKAMGASRSIARVYAPVFRDLSTFDYQRHFGIDRMLSLEHLTALELAREIRNPSSVILEHFARGAVEVHDIVVHKGPATGRAIRELGFPGKMRIGSIQRGKRMWIAGAEDVLEEDDHIVVFGYPEQLDEYSAYWSCKKLPDVYVTIAGGGETGSHLARSLKSSRFHVSLMEADLRRCEVLAAQLPSVRVIHCNATDKSVMEEEGVGKADVFVACTGDDENNIMAGVEAKEIGAERIFAIVGRPDYANIVGRLGINRAVSEREVMAKQILGYMNTGSVISKTMLPGGGVWVCEVEVQKNAKVMGTPISQLDIPSGCVFATRVRGDQASIPGANDTFEEGDNVVILVEDHIVNGVLSLFAAGPRS